MLRGFAIFTADHLDPSGMAPSVIHGCKDWARSFGSVESRSLLLLLVHAFATTALAGLIWTIQVVHYPLFSEVGTAEFAKFHHDHSFRITLIVGPLMAVEGLATLWLLVRRPEGVSWVFTWGAAVVLAIVHLATIGLSVPAHNRLAQGFTSSAYTRLVNTNWVRTIGWSTRAVLAFVMIAVFVNAIKTVKQ
jgi:hypothetical protein